MRLLLTTDTIGGVWSFTLTLTRGLLRAGHTVALISFGRLPSPAQYADVEALRLDSREAFVFVASEAPLEWMEANDRAWSEGAAALNRLIADFTPDLLHSSQMCFGSLHAGIPVLVTLHSDVLSWAESTLPQGIAELAQTAAPVWFTTYRELVTTGLEEASLLAAPTHWMARTAERIYDLARKPQVIMNGIEPITNRPAVTRKLQAVTAGRLWDQAKGLAILDEVKSPVHIIIVGDRGSEHCASHADVQWQGAVSQPLLRSLFAESAVYLATSLYEPFGLAPLEAAAEGCAIIARDLPSFHEIWADAALYFTSAASLASLLTDLSTSPQLLQASQSRAQKQSQRYTARAMTDGYLALYESLLTGANTVKEPSSAHA